MTKILGKALLSFPQMSLFLTTVMTKMNFNKLNSQPGLVQVILLLNND